MPNQPFTLYKRKTHSGHMYYANFRLPNGTRSSGKSTGQTNRKAAEAWAMNHVHEFGILTPESRVTFAEYARDFFSFDGRYVRTRKAHGYTLSATHIRGQQRNIRTHLIPQFGMLQLKDVTAAIIEDFLMEVYEKGHEVKIEQRQYARRKRLDPNTPRTVNRLGFNGQVGV